MQWKFETDETWNKNRFISIYILFNPLKKNKAEKMDLNWFKIDLN